MTAFLIFAFLLLADMVLLLKAITISLSLYDRYDQYRIQKQIREEVEAYERQGKHAID